SGTPGRVHSHAEESHAGAPATATLIGAGGLEATGCRLLHERVAASPAERIRLLDVAEQCAGVFVVFDGLQGDLGDGEPTVGGPLVAVLDGCAERLGETDGVTLNAGDAVSLARVVRVV